MEKEHDVLHIKKGSEENIRYYSSRSERLSLFTAPKQDKKIEGIFRGNRSLLFILVDIVLLIVVIFLLNTFSLFSPDKKNLTGYSLVLQGYPSGGLINAIVRVKRLTENADIASNSVSVRFFVSDSDSPSEYFASSNLPQSAHESVIVRGYVPFAGNRQVLKAEVYIGESQVILTRTVKRD